MYMRNKGYLATEEEIQRGLNEESEQVDAFRKLGYIVEVASEKNNIKYHCDFYIKNTEKSIKRWGIDAKSYTEKYDNFLINWDEDYPTYGPLYSRQCSAISFLYKGELRIYPTKKMLKLAKETKADYINHKLTKNSPIKYFPSGINNRSYITISRKYVMDYFYIMPPCDKKK